jgi:nucleotide-binding universal stress UspA family protein
MPMLPLTRILCPTDFSEPATRALETAAELAQHFGAELILFHVVAPCPSLPPSMVGASRASLEGLREGLLEAARQALEELRASKLPAGTACRLEAREGDAANEIVRAAEELEVSLIAIASHGRTGWRRFVSGSVAEKVARTAPCPVLALRTSPPTDPDD